MSSIKLKIANCIDCGKEGPVIAKRCQLCYKKHRSKVNAEKTSNKAKKVQKEVFGTYFASQAHKMPARCEETGQLLPTKPEWLKKSCMAHILPKRDKYGFPSVALHPKNMVFLMPDIHQNFDNLGESYIVKMKIYPILKERVAALIPLLTEAEKRKVPEYYL
jgi:hypothetical protein